MISSLDRPWHIKRPSNGHALTNKYSPVRVYCITGIPGQSPIKCTIEEKRDRSGFDTSMVFVIVFHYDFETAAKFSFDRLDFQS